MVTDAGRQPEATQGQGCYRKQPDQRIGRALATAIAAEGYDVALNGSGETLTIPAAMAVWLRLFGGEAVSVCAKTGGHGIYVALLTDGVVVLEQMAQDIARLIECWQSACAIHVV